jgi:crotonobetainyl-CoA:carnitine CoA-transferase CaiB-like acyl-CoA transferase
LPRIRELFRTFSKADLVAKLERTGLPFAPIGKPEELFDDPHLLASGGLGLTTLPDGRETLLPILPIEMGGLRPQQDGSLAKPGQQTDEVLAMLGIAGNDIAVLRAAKVVG